MAGKRVIATGIVLMSAFAGLALGERAVAGEGTLLSNVRQLTFEGRRAGGGFFNGDGRSMIFQSEREDRNPFHQTYLMDLESGDVRRVSPGVGKSAGGRIHPSNIRLLIASTHDDGDARAKQAAELELRVSGKGRRGAGDFDERFDIYEFDLEDETYRNLTEAPGYDAEGAYSPAGGLIAFASNRHAYGGGPSAGEARGRDFSALVDVYVMSADGIGVRRLTDAPGYDGAPAFRPDGRKIAWHHVAEDGASAEIYTMNVDGSGKKRITRLGARSSAPFYHPSGDYIIFSADGDGDVELYIVDAGGRSEPVRVTESKGFDGRPTFSRIGGRLAWVSERTPGGAPQIFLTDWNDAKARLLLGLEPVDGDPAGKTLLVLTRQGLSDIDIRLHVAGLASGLAAGGQGKRSAADYIAAAFGELGLEPAGDGGTYLQDFAAGGDRDRRNVLARLGSGAPADAPALVIGVRVNLPATGRSGDGDDHSGVAALLEIAQYLAALENEGELRARRDILFAAWSGDGPEPAGSAHFARRTGGGPIAAYLDLGGIGSLQRHLYLAGAGSSPAWPRTIERANVPVGLSIVTRNGDDPQSDARGFSHEDVPALRASTDGGATRVDYSGVAKVARLMANIALSLARDEAAPEFRRRVRPTVSIRLQPLALKSGSAVRARRRAAATATATDRVEPLAAHGTEIASALPVATEPRPAAQAATRSRTGVSVEGHRGSWWELSPDSRTPAPAPLESPPRDRRLPR